MYRILTLNHIAAKGLERFGREHYEVASEIPHPDAILVRSFDMHTMEIPEGLKAVGRAGAGVNNIPVEDLSERGIAVFNAPGANANAVKELVLAGMLLAARNICQAWAYTRELQGDDAELHRQVEAGKKRFAGFELTSRTLGVIGLGAIGVQVANAARGLGMEVVGYDPHMTVGRAWQLDAGVRQAASVDDLVARCDMLSLHVPLNEHTRHLLDADRIQALRPGTVLLNFARDGIVDAAAVLRALDAGHLHAYVCDFPGQPLQGHDRVIALPHLGASTVEAEENCAVMVADQLRDYLEHGNVHNAVNLPEVHLPRAGDARLAIINRNRPDMVGQISHVLGQNGINIVHMVNESRAGLAYSLIDTEGGIDEEAARGIAGIDGVLRMRVL